MEFNRLRLTGFKSFVDPTELYIEPGITAIVGPNGCGKSNLIEALRWVMGENSAKSMRGGGMDDVIFAGTADRPARNLADVTLLIDNSARVAPPGYNDSDQIEVSRRIEREAGSAYRINGREVRQRDVQLLFADAATGPHSPAMVSQGRIGALIAAKPCDRRAILEEAAGISGLHSRRHEAELRLRAAENNLLRLDDVMVQIEGQLRGLKRQARQATRYKNLSGHIRRAEALLFYVKWLGAGAALEVAERQLGEIEAAVAKRTQIAAKASTAQAGIAAQLPGLRDREAAASAALHRLAAARDGLDAEERRTRDVAGQLRARIEQITHDTAREKSLIVDARGALERLDRERLELGAGDSQDAARAAAEDEVRKAHGAASGAESELDQLNEASAAAVARRSSLAREIEQTDLRLARLRQEAERVEGTLRELAEGRAQDPDGALGEAIEAKRGEIDQAREAMNSADEDRLAVVAAEAQSRELLTAAEALVAGLRAETSALAELAEAGGGEDYPPVIDGITVEPGYEIALGAALGDDLTMPDAPEAPIHWSEDSGPEIGQQLPEGAEPLSGRVRAPPGLTRRLSQIGVVDGADGPRLSAALLPGQRLVSCDGALWRWDGFSAAAGVLTTAAARLEQRNRLEDLRAELIDGERALADAREHFEAAHRATAAAGERETAARRAWRAGEDEMAGLRQRQVATDKAAEQRAARMAAAEEARARLARDIEESAARAKTAHETLAALPEDDALRDRIGELRTTVETRRTVLARARGAFDSLERDVRARLKRLEAIALEHDAWDLRVSNANSQLKRLDTRAGEARSELAAIEGRPAEIEILRVALVEKLSGAEQNRQQAADTLANAETELATRDRELKQAQHSLAEAREQRVRIEAERDQATERRQTIEQRMLEELDCEPDETAEAAGLEGEGPHDLASVESITARLERFKRERDNMGPVNLRADVEARELDEQLTVMRDERGDLESAIGRLRQAIGSLNREGRERLLAAFGEVDKHFQALFQELFGGGKAHLALTESDDPLAAGLEIMACPPGKKLQILSLLSGGEQALTALALIFAVFLTNPAPICVLDEVDAPLDDANVGRFCDLMQRITRITKTRFLIVSHHPITMSRVDRLFGVTMGERGISQLVSVDLGEAERLQAVG